jgi:hypothetical protein
MVPTNLVIFGIEYYIFIKNIKIWRVNFMKDFLRVFNWE